MSPLPLLPLLLLAALLVSDTLPAKLPHYFKPCRRSDPKLDECALKHGSEAIPFIVQGDPKLGIPKLDPLVIDRIVVGDDGGKKGAGGGGGGGLGISFTCIKCRFTGLKGVQPKAVRVDLKKQHLELRGVVPQLTVRGKYSARGKVLVLPIAGEGDAQLTLRDLDVVYNVDYDVKKGKDGLNHIKIKKPKFEFKVSGFNISLTNLFKGDENLGRQMNVFLNENWRDVLAEFGPAVGEAVNRIVTLVVNNIADRVPMDEVLLPD